MNKALLVGINNYPDPENVLHGCINDITDMSDYLVSQCGFTMDDIRLLADERASKANIVERLKWLVTGAKAGDRLLFHYSGHGAQMASRKGSGEVDRLDEVICPYDFDWTSTHALRDKEFVQIFKSIPLGVSFVWISDSCHSGGLTKGFAKKKVGTKSRMMAPPVDIAWRNATALELKLKANNLQKAAKEINVALISGCQSNQTSADAVFNKRANGALTYYLLKELKSRSGSVNTLKTLVQKVNNDMSVGGYTQNPQLEGSSALFAKPFLKL